MNHWIVSITSELFASMETYFAELKPSLCFFCRRGKLDQIVESLWLEGFISLVLELQFGFIAIQTLRAGLPSQEFVGNGHYLTCDELLGVVGPGDLCMNRASDFSL